jgi:hypothetical protein
MQFKPDHGIAPLPMFPRNLGFFDRITASYEKSLPDLDAASDRVGNLTPRGLAG